MILIFAGAYTLLVKLIWGIVQGVGFAIGVVILLKFDLLKSKERKSRILSDSENSKSLEFITEKSNENHSDTKPYKEQNINESRISSRSCSLGNEFDLISEEVSVECGGRSVELLVHNVSHADMVLSLGGKQIFSDPDASEKEKFALCRPRFSAFDLFSKRIFKFLPTSLKSNGEQRNNTDIIYFPKYERADTPRYHLRTPRSSRQEKLPVGFHLYKKVPIQPEELPWLRIRGKDAQRVKDLDSILKRFQKTKYEDFSPTVGKCDSTTSVENLDLYINAIFFPLLATLLAKWEHENRFVRKKVKKVIILVSGVGSPRNFTHSLQGNSTRFCSELMEIFIKYLYPEITVVKIHSDNSNIFRYDENITFVKRNLMPCIDAYRDAHATDEPYPDETKITKHTKSFNPNWKNTFHVTLSFADGSTARTFAIQAALRPYKPTYFHFWQLKTFWHEIKICEDDIELHSYEEMEIIPAIDVSIASARVQEVVNEMRLFKEDFLKKMTQDNDLAKFWLRKTKKPVLAVLLVEKQCEEDGTRSKPILYRGTNMEVSMPTGSLCAERNVIGTALAADFSLKREDLRMVAVLAVPFKFDNPKASSNNVFQNKNYCEEIVSQVQHRLQQESDRFPTESNSLSSSPLIGPNSLIKPSMSMSSFTSFVLENADKTEDVHSSFMTQRQTNLSSNNSEDKNNRNGFPTVTMPLDTEEDSFVRRINLYSDTEVVDKEKEKCCSDGICIGSPNNSRTPTFVKSDKTKYKRSRKTVIVHSSQDINPLNPCGACQEWLKKISEYNPYFQVITFTDADCNGIYINSCQD